MANDGVISQRVGPVHEVLPHEVLGEGEMAQHNVFHNLESRRVLHRKSNAVPDGRDINTAVVRRQLSVDPRNFDLEVPAEHLQQRRVETWLVVVDHHPDATTHGSSFKCDRTQDQRSAKPARVFLIPFPEQEANGEIKGVGTAFLQGCLSLPINLYGSM